MTHEERLRQRHRRKVRRALVAQAERRGFPNPEDVMEFVDLDSIDLDDDGQPVWQQVSNVVEQVADTGNILWHRLDDPMCLVEPPPAEERIRPTGLGQGVHAMAEPTFGEANRMARLQQLIVTPGMPAEDITSWQAELDQLTADLRDRGGEDVRDRARRNRRRTPPAVDDERIERHLARIHRDTAGSVDTGLAPDRTLSLLLDDRDDE